MATDLATAEIVIRYGTAFIGVAEGFLEAVDWCDTYGEDGEVFTLVTPDKVRYLCHVSHGDIDTWTVRADA